MNAFGAYADAGEYLADVVAQAQTLDGNTVTWKSSALTREVFARLLARLIPAGGDREALTAALDAFAASGRALPADPALVPRLDSAAAKAVYALLTAGSLEGARQVMGALPAAVREMLDGLSPIRHLSAIHADAFVMYDTGDTYVPYGQSVELADGLRPLGRLARSSQFRLFDHVEAKGVDLVGAAPELWKLLWHVQAVLMETL